METVGKAKTMTSLLERGYDNSAKNPQHQTQEPFAPPSTTSNSEALTNDVSLALKLPPIRPTKKPTPVVLREHASLLSPSNAEIQTSPEPSRIHECAPKPRRRKTTHTHTHAHLNAKSPRTTRFRTKTKSRKPMSIGRNKTPQTMNILRLGSQNSCTSVTLERNASS